MLFIYFLHPKKNATSRFETSQKNLSLTNFIENSINIYRFTMKIYFITNLMILTWSDFKLFDLLGSENCILFWMEGVIKET